VKETASKEGSAFCMQSPLGKMGGRANARKEEHWKFERESFEWGARRGVRMALT